MMGYQTADGEVYCSEENLVMIPEGSMQVYLRFNVSGEGEHRDFSKDGVTFRSRWKNGRFWFSRNDTEEIRHLFSGYWRARRGREPPPKREDRPSFKAFDKLRADFDKNEKWVHNFTEKCIRLGLSKNEALSLWDKARTVSYFSYSCRKLLQHKRENPEIHLDNFSNPTSTVTFCNAFSRPVKHGHVEIPISHHFTHRPKIAGCPVCEKAKAQLTPVVKLHCEEGEEPIKGGRLRIDIDAPGKAMPQGSDGSKQCVSWSSEEGHFAILHFKTKSILK